ncbi:unnamed protein product [Durusdinium trenchii]|uniref:Uncharacterized protein n=2 Tax=Durusdinium trenchii TaxID=1381693 RepID=A0ABP0QJS8_9DINO
MELCSSLKSVRLRKWDRPHFGLHMGQVAPHHQRVRLGLARKALGIALLSYSLWHPKRPSQRLVCRPAVVEDDEHAMAVQAWLQTIIIKIGLCPWAKTADEAGGIRVVTSLASSPEDALLDLKAEAAKLKGSLAALPQGCPTTTLLVCPMVGEWEEFARFSVFREEELLNGDALTDEFQCKVVCFHPHQQASNSYGLNPGDEILVAQNGEQFSANVLEISGSTPRDIKVQLFGRVRQGETDAEMVIEPFLDSEDHIETIPEVDVLQLIGRDALQDEEGSRSILGRAPRVVLHLLRCKDLEAIDDKKAFETLERNEEVVEELGLEGFDELLERCG